MTATTQLTPETPSEVPTDIETDQTRPASVLGKAHLILQAFATGAPTMGLTELSRRSGVSKASAHRLAGELVDLGLLARTPKGYQLGWRMFELGQLVPGPASLRSVARPSLMDLRSITRAVVHLAVPQGLDCIYLERFAGRREMTLIKTVATRVPSCRTASGQVFLAYGDPASLGELGEDALVALGVGTHADLEGRFATIRERRYAGEPRQCVPGLKTIAVPVFYPGMGQVVAAISVTISVDRRDDQQVTHALWAAANDISRGIGGGSTLRRGVAS